MEPKDKQLNTHVYTPSQGAFLDDSKEATLHRGLANITTKEVDTANLGHHWSPDTRTPGNFIHTGGPVASSVKHGVILSGTFDTKDVFDPSDGPLSKRDRKFVRNNGVMTDALEREVTARVDRPVKNVSAIEYNKGKLVGGRFYGSGNTGRAAVGRS